MRFRFRLQSFLRFTDLQEKAAQKRFATCALELQRLQTERGARDEELKVLLQKVREEFFLPKREVMEARVVGLLAILEGLKGQEEQIRDRLEAAQVELAHWAFRRKGLEELRHKKQLEFRQLTNKQQQKRDEERYLNLQVRREDGD